MYIFEINVLAVLLAVLLRQIIGYLWYAPFLFGKTWAKDSGVDLTKMDPKAQKKAILVATLLSIVMAVILHYFLDITRSVTPFKGMYIAYWLWMGFTATTALTNYTYQMKPMRLFLVETGYNLITMLLMGGLIAWMN
jgi:hypothetical protein